MPDSLSITDLIEIERFETEHPGILAKWFEYKRDELDYQYSLDDLERAEDEEYKRGFSDGLKGANASPP